MLSVLGAPRTARSIFPSNGVINSSLQCAIAVANEDANVRAENICRGHIRFSVAVKICNDNIRRIRVCRIRDLCLESSVPVSEQHMDIRSCRSGNRDIELAVSIQIAASNAEGI